MADGELFENEVFDVEKDLPDFLITVLDKVEYICHSTFDQEAAEAHAVVIDKSIALIRSIEDCCDVDSQDKVYLDSVSTAFANVLSSLSHHIAICRLTPTTVANINTSKTNKASLTAGRPSYNISAEILEELRGLGFTWTKIGEMLGVSRWTISRRVAANGLQDMSGFNQLSDVELDKLVKDFISNHGTATGQGYVAGYIKSLGLRVQRRRIRESMARVDPQNTALRWGIVVSRRTYQVPWPNSLWHLDGHHSLIRWKLVIHGCIDGFSRRIMFLRCSNNNLAETVLELFLDAVNRDDELWPSRIRVDKGVENVLVCDAMVQARGEGRGSFIAGPSTHNQRIERLWRDVFRCVCHIYYYTFYAMESTGILNPDDPIHLFTLHLIFVPRINKSLDEFLQAFNNHRVSTEGNWTPYQMWTNGMMHAGNPLAVQGQLDELETGDLEMYGYDAQGPSSVGKDNNVVVQPVELDHQNLIASHVLATLNPLRQSCEMGIDVFTQALELILHKMEDLDNYNIDTSA
jgi:hypothetical protein